MTLISKYKINIFDFYMGTATSLQEGILPGWFSMSPLPRLHHHDITTIVTVVESFSHILTQTKKKRRHSLVLALALTLTVTLRPDHSATRNC